MPTYDVYVDNDKRSRYDISKEDRDAWEGGLCWHIYMSADKYPLFARLLRTVDDDAVITFVEV